MSCGPTVATLKIVSGGQTGADRGALLAALQAGLACGGWCPDGRLAEDGRVPDEDLTRLLVELQLHPRVGLADRPEARVAGEVRRGDRRVLRQFCEPNPLRCR